MIELTLLASLLSEHNSFHWDMSCADWNRNRIEILADESLGSDAQEYLLDYLRTKVEGDCETYIIGRKYRLGTDRSSRKGRKSSLKERTLKSNYFRRNQKKSHTEESSMTQKEYNAKVLAESHLPPKT